MTYPTERKFINELGNEITILIRNVMGHEEEIETSIEIDILGPNSQNEWILTQKEAGYLSSALLEHLV